MGFGMGLTTEINFGIGLTIEISLIIGTNFWYVLVY